MYVILAYDVGVERNAKVLRIARRYLTWVQNSLLEGELTPAQLRRLTHELSQAIDEEVDSVQFYVFSRGTLPERRHLGVIKNLPSQFL